MAVRLAVIDGLTGKIRSNNEPEAYVKDWPGCPWPRIPTVGELVDCIGDYVPVSAVYFHLNGNVEICANIPDGWPLLKPSWIKALTAAGFQPLYPMNDRFED